MEKQAYLNLEYEYELFKRPFSNKLLKKLREEYSFLYFLGIYKDNGPPLYVSQRPSEGYINFFTDLGFPIKYTCRLGFKENVWGEISDLHNKTNSKKTVQELACRLWPKQANDYRWSFDKTNPLEEVLVRHHGEVSGKGQRVQKSDDIQKLDLSEDWVITPFLDKISDFGALYNKGHLKVWKRFDSQKGTVQGLEYSQDINTLFDRSKGEEITAFYEYALSFCEKFSKENGIDSFQIDVMSYLKNENTHFYICEVNHRNTVGSCLFKFFEKLQVKTMKYYTTNKRTSFLDRLPEVVTDQAYFKFSLNHSGRREHWVEGDCL